MKLAEVTKQPKGFRLTGIYRISRFDVKTAKNGKAYGDCMISDTSGDVPAKYWDITAETAAVMSKHGILRLEAMLDFFKDNPQFTIIRIGVPAESDTTAMLRNLGLMAKQDLAVMYGALLEFIAAVGNEQFRLVLTHIFAGEFSRQFQHHPGAVWNHHAWIGGLLEHTLEVAASAVDYCKRNPSVNQDILLSAALLHDIGKVQEIEVDDIGLPVGFTRAGKLLRHIYLGMERVEYACRATGASPEVALILKHCILAHHGQPEWGSPVEPMMVEAEVLHYLDNLSAKTDQFGRDEERTAPGGFTRSATLRRDVYRPELK